MNFYQYLPTWRDCVDIVVVAVFLYYFLLLVRGTRAVQILQGVVVLLVMQALFYQLKLQAAYFIVRAAVLSIVVALPIVFQPELRRALMQLGSRSIVSPFTHVSRDVLVKIIDEISWAASILSQTRYGALMVIERETGLEEFVEKGVRVNGEVSSKLLLSIFIPRSPLHDGAAIIRGDKVVAASCYLPLSDEPHTTGGRTIGTRHRAAIGITEQTDAIVVVVSEETGSISIAKDGRLTSNIDEETLKKTLLTFCAPPPRPEAGATSTELWNRIRGFFRPRAPQTRTLNLAEVPPPPALPEPDVVTRVLKVEEVDAVVPEPPPFEAPAANPREEEEKAEAQRLHEEAVQKRAEEAKRREAEKKQQKAEEEARRADDEGTQAPAKASADDKPPADGPTDESSLQRRLRG